MNQIIANHRARAGRMKDFFTAQNSNIASYADIINEITKFNNQLVQFDAFAARQQQPIKGYAQEKALALKDAAELASKWGVRCHVQAENEDLLALAELLNTTVAELEGMDNAQGLNRMKEMRDGLNDNIAIFAEQGLTAGIITEITSAITAYEALINKPKEAISGRKMETLAIEEYMKVINKQLEDIVSLLQAAWTPDHLDLIAEMKNNYRIDDLGHRFSGIEGSIMNAIPEALANYKVVCVKQKTTPGEQDYVKEAQSNILGEYKIQTMRPGLYEVKLHNPLGFVVKTAVIKIDRGVTLDYDWSVIF